MNQNLYIAATRFGMGMGPQEVRIADASSAVWLWNQIQQPETTRDFANFPSAKDQIIKFMQAKQSKDDVKDKDAKRDVRRDWQQNFRNEMQARIAHAVTTTTPFYERLVNFWSNHFTVSIQKGVVIGLAAAYEREAIRPYVTGRFEDMLLAVAHHPAMLHYLDNAQSIGADSFAGVRQKKGLNENLAREIMELHTLGVNGGYTQTDVTNFAKVLTGWSVADRNAPTPGIFEFYIRRHEPGTQTIMGRTYQDNGEDTAQHIAFKLARHFIADNPPDSAVKLIASSFLQSGGDLKTVYHTLLSLPESWSLATPKIKSSYDLIVSAARFCADGTPLDTAWCLQALQFLGNAPFNASSPAGLPDTIRDIAGPEAVMRRIEWAQGAGAKLADNRSYRDRMEAAIGPVMSPKTRAALDGTNSLPEQLALFFGSPEFQRR